MWIKAQNSLFTFNFVGYFPHHTAITFQDGTEVQASIKVTQEEYDKVLAEIMLSINEGDKLVDVDFILKNMRE